MVKNPIKAQMRRVRFERHASQVVFDPASSSFVVTWEKCNRPAEERIARQKDPLSWIPSVAAVADLYDRGCIPQSQVVYAAMSIGRAWAAGDRYMLDTDGSRKAAELLHDLSAMCVNASSQTVARDVGQAMRHLLDEMAEVRLLSLDEADFADEKVMPPLEKSVKECFSVKEFTTWPHKSMRRRFMFCLNKKERTQLSYTLISLLFDIGPCPLLSLSNRRIVRSIAIRESGMGGEFSEKTFVAFFRSALAILRKAKEDGMSTIGARVAQQPFIDIISGSSTPA